MNNRILFSKKVFAIALLITLFPVYTFASDVRFKANGHIIWNQGSNSDKMTPINNLLWEDQSFNMKGSKTWYQAKKHCSSLSLEYQGIVFDQFRLPSKDELLSLKANKYFLKHFKTSYVWSSDASNNTAWNVNPFNGFSYNKNKSYNLSTSIRCVSVLDLSQIDINKFADAHYIKKN